MKLVVAAVLVNLGLSSALIATSAEAQAPRNRIVLPPARVPVLLVPQGTYSAFPPNNLHTQDRVQRIADITEAEFNQIIDEAVAFYIPIVEAHGARLEVKKDWKNSTVNAYASQSGNVWQIAMFGGLARRPEVTKDGFALVVCHELGHHLAGYAFYDNTGWASSEGESDYWATRVCARRIWGDETVKNRQFRRRSIPEVVKTSCDAAWRRPNEQELCYRTALAGHSLATLLGSIGGDEAPPKFETPDPTKVTKTNTRHPRAQCRLDTYFQGTLCTKPFDDRKIPGRKHPSGQLSAAAEAEAMRTSCMTRNNDTGGLRPACWFKALVE